MAKTAKAKGVKKEKIKLRVQTNTKIGGTNCLIVAGAPSL
jgi:hypothetical protein